MSSISGALQQAFEQALEHAQTLKQHGEAFEKLAKSLDGRLLTREQVEFIGYVGQQIQKHAQIMKSTAELALENKQCSLEEYALMQQQQHQAVLLHVKAIRVMLQVTLPPL